MKKFTSICLGGAMGAPFLSPIGEAKLLTTVYSAFQLTPEFDEGFDEATDLILGLQAELDGVLAEQRFFGNYSYWRMKAKPGEESVHAKDKPLDAMAGLLKLLFPSGSEFKPSGSCSWEATFHSGKMGSSEAKARVVATLLGCTQQARLERLCGKSSLQQAVSVYLASGKNTEAQETFLKEVFPGKLTPQTMSAEQKQAWTDLGLAMIQAVQLESLTGQVGVYPKGYANVVVCAYAWHILTSDAELYSLAKYLQHDKVLLQAQFPQAKDYWKPVKKTLTFNKVATVGKVTPFPFEGPPVCNGPAWFSTIKEPFPDCVENTVRLFCCLIFSKKDRGQWIVDTSRIPDGPLKEYFLTEKETRKLAALSSTKARSAWASVVSGPEKKDFGIWYCNRKECCELDTGWRNMILTLCYLLRDYQPQTNQEGPQKAVQAIQTVVSALQGQRTFEGKYKILQKLFPDANSVVSFMNALLGINTSVDLKAQNLSVDVGFTEAIPHVISSRPELIGGLMITDGQHKAVMWARTNHALWTHDYSSMPLSFTGYPQLALWSTLKQARAGHIPVKKALQTIDTWLSSPHSTPFLDAFARFVANLPLDQVTPPEEKEKGLAYQDNIQKILTRAREMAQNHPAVGEGLKSVEQFCAQRRE